MPKQKLKWNRENVREKLMTDDRWLYRGLMTIYSRQTADEQQSGYTVEDNGIGFNGVDADFLTQMARSYEQYGRLTPKMLEVTRKLMLKYAGQLARVANANEAEKQRGQHPDN
jgi:hypothetical protein